MENNKRPVEEIREEGLKATLWENQGEDGRPFYSVTFCRFYKMDGQWRQSPSFSYRKLDRLYALILKVEAWMVEHGATR